MPELSKKDKLRLLTIMLESRHADLREQNLNRQGKGHFHVSGMGHEALAAVSIQMEPDDYIVPYYRDRGLVLGRGMTTQQLALEYFAKRKTGSAGRMMPSHYSDLERHIWSVPTPTGSQLLPGCGMAWGIQLAGEDVQQIYDAAAGAIEKMRAGGGPHFWWVTMERLSSHTSSDDQKLYRSAAELAEIEKRDPVKCWQEKLIAEGVLKPEEFAKIDNEIKERIRREYAEAEKAEDPSPNELEANVTGALPKIDKEILPPGKYRIGDTVNKTLRLGLEEDPRRVIF